MKRKVSAYYYTTIAATIICSLSTLNLMFFRVIRISYTRLPSMHGAFYQNKPQTHFSNVRLIRVHSHLCVLSVSPIQYQYRTRKKAMHIG